MSHSRTDNGSWPNSAQNEPDIHGKEDSAIAHRTRAATHQDADVARRVALDAPTLNDHVPPLTPANFVTSQRRLIALVFPESPHHLRRFLQDAQPNPATMAARRRPRHQTSSLQPSSMQRPSQHRMSVHSNWATTHASIAILHRIRVS